MVGYVSFGAVYFFMLQPWVITFEIAVRYFVTGSTHSSSMVNGKEAGTTWKLLGYVWVLSWFVAVGPFLQQPMIDTGVFVAGLKDSEVARMAGRWLALDVI